MWWWSAPMGHGKSFSRGRRGVPGRGRRRDPRRPPPGGSRSGGAASSRVAPGDSARASPRPRGGTPREHHPARNAPPPAGPRRRSLSESVAKTGIEPRHAERTIDIPRFCLRSIPIRGAFATDSDTTPPRLAPGVPSAPPRPYDEQGRPAGEDPRGVTTPRVGDSPGGSASTTPFSLYYAPPPSTVREKGA